MSLLDREAIDSLKERSFDMRDLDSVMEFVEQEAFPEMAAEFGGLDPTGGLLVTMDDAYDDILDCLEELAGDREVAYEDEVRDAVRDGIERAKRGVL